jgi:hypothetical protein
LFQNDQAWFNSFRVLHEQEVLEPFSEDWSARNEVPYDDVLFRELKLKLLFVFVEHGAVTSYLELSGGR